MLLDVQLDARPDQAATRAERYNLRHGRPSMPGISDRPA